MELDRAHLFPFGVGSLPMRAWPVKAQAWCRQAHGEGRPGEEDCTGRAQEEVRCPSRTCLCATPSRCEPQYVPAVSSGSQAVVFACRKLHAAVIGIHLAKYGQCWKATSCPPRTQAPWYGPARVLPASCLCARTSFAMQVVLDADLANKLACIGPYVHVGYPTENQVTDPPQPSSSLQLHQPHQSFDWRSIRCLPSHAHLLCRLLSCWF